MPVRVLGVDAKAVIGDEEPLWHVRVSYGKGLVFDLPLPARLLLTDASNYEHVAEAVAGMESLGTALLRSASRMRRKLQTRPRRSTGG